MARPKMTHKEHVAYAEKFRAVDKALADLYFAKDGLQEKFGKANPMCKKLMRIMDLFHVHLKSEIDSEYHKATTNEEFIAAGNVYYRAPGE